MLMDEMYESAICKLMQEEYLKAEEMFAKCIKIPLVLIRRKVRFTVAELN